MDYHGLFQVSAAGMALEKMRMEVTALNLAHQHQAAPSVEQLYRPQRVVAAPGFGAQFGQWMQPARPGGVAVAAEVAPRLVRDAAHPYANAQGMVAYPGIDQVQEMVNLNMALRAYEANVAAFNAARTMASRTLDIGGQT